MEEILKINDHVEYITWSGETREGRVKSIEICKNREKYDNPTNQVTLTTDLYAVVILHNRYWCYNDQITKINGKKLTFKYNNMNKKRNCLNCGDKSEIRKQENKTASRLDALHAAGVDTTNIFAMRKAAGEEILVRMEGKGISIIANDDPIFDAIKNGNTIPERRLFRRWVMAQMFHMLADNSDIKSGYTKALNQKGYEYSWKMAMEEFRVQKRLETNDPENYFERNRWFNKEVAYNMASDYIKDFKKEIKKLKRHSCKGVPYVTINKRDIFVEDIEKKIFSPLKAGIKKILDATDAAELYVAFSSFNGMRVKHFVKDHKSRAWTDAYKGSGAYYTLKNLILFHGCIADGCEDKKASIAYLETLAEEYSSEGWRMLAYLRKFLTDNNIDIQAKMKEWQNR